MLHVFCVIQQIKRKASAIQRLAVDLPQQFQIEIKHAQTVMQRHKHLFTSQSNNLSVLQDQLSQLQETLQDVTDRHAKEKKRRQELHNILMVKWLVKSCSEYKCTWCFQTNTTGLNMFGMMVNHSVNHILTLLQYELEYTCNIWIRNKSQ